jgi:hypothetical protein
VLSCCSYQPLIHTNIREYRTIHNRLTPLRPQGFGWGRRGGGDEGPTARKAVWLSP